MPAAIMPELQLDSIRRQVSSSYYARGMDYVRKGKVLRVEQVSENRIDGEVAGSGRNVYLQEITIDNHGNIDGYCDCPVDYNCKHVAAVLITMKKQNADKSEIKERLDWETEKWLDDLENILEEKPDEKATNKRLIYILDISHNNAVVIPKAGNFRKNGTLGKLENYNPDNATRHTPAKFLTSDDVRLLRRINSHSSGGYSCFEYKLGDDIGADLLRDMIRTGRCYWGKHGTNPLRYGDKRIGKLGWEISDNGKQHIHCLVDDVKKVVILPLNPPYYVDLLNNMCGIIQLDIPNNIAASLLKSPPLDKREAELVSQRLARFTDKVPIELPKKYKHKKLPKIKPLPCLYLHCTKFTTHAQYGWREITKNLPIATLFFDYNGVRLPYDKKFNSVTSVQNDEVVEMSRHKEFEKSCIKTLSEYELTSMEKCRTNWKGVNKKPENFVFDTNVFNQNVQALRSMGVDTINMQSGYSEEGADQLWMEFIADDIEILKYEGWQIEIDDTFPFRIHKANEEWDVSIDEGSGIDWFDFGVKTKIDGQEYNILPLLLRMMKFAGDNLDEFIDVPDDHNFMLPLLNKPGEFFQLPARRVKTILNVLKDLHSFNSLVGDDETIQMSRSEALLMADIEAAADASDLRWFGGDKVREIGRRLKDFSGIEEIPTPKKFNGKLRDYQKDGLNWLNFLSEYGFGGVLADDMGLGKTIQALAWLVHEKEQKKLKHPALIIAPTSLMHNWMNEAKRFAPDMKVLLLHGADRKERFSAIAKHDIVLTTYPLLTRDKDVLLPQQYHSIILDEAQNIKNSRARNTQIVHQLKANHRLCLTGTPMENHLGELWSLFHFLQPGFLGDEKLFRSFYRKPIEKEDNIERREALVRRIKPFVLRRTKEQVAPELPLKSNFLRSAEFGSAQRDLYESVRLAMHEKVRKEIAKKGMAKSHIIVLDALLKMRQVCCDPRLLKLDSAKKVKSSAKLVMLMDLLPEMIEEGRKVLLFSSFTTMLRLIEDECIVKNINYVKLTGSTKDRKTPIDTFQNGDVPLFLISLKAGGVGLNLTAADTVIHYDPWWNPAAENQATDRAHRIGQDKPVFVYKMIATGTVEEKILYLQKKKQALTDAIFDTGKSSNAKLSEKDLTALFEPM